MLTGNALARALTIPSPEKSKPSFSRYSPANKFKVMRPPFAEWVNWAHEATLVGHDQTAKLFEVKPATLYVLMAGGTFPRPDVTRRVGLRRHHFWRFDTLMRENDRRVAVNEKRGV